VKVSKIKCSAYLHHHFKKYVLQVTDTKTGKFTHGDGNKKVNFTSEAYELEQCFQ